MNVLANTMRLMGANRRKFRMGYSNYY